MFAIEKLAAGEPYHDSAIDWLDSIAPGLHSDLSGTADLPAELTRAVVDGAVELTCQCQNVMNIMIGRFILMGLPPAVVETHLESVSLARLNWNDCYEILRLLEVVDALGPPHWSWASARALRSEDPDVVEAATEFGPTS